MPWESWRGQIHAPHGRLQKAGSRWGIGQTCLTTSVGGTCWRSNAPLELTWWCFYLRCSDFKPWNGRQLWSLQNQVAVAMAALLAAVFDQRPSDSNNLTSLRHNGMMVGMRGNQSHMAELFRLCSEQSSQYILTHPYAPCMVYLSTGWFCSGKCC